MLSVCTDHVRRGGSRGLGRLRGAAWRYPLARYALVKVRQKTYERIRPRPYGTEVQQLGFTTTALSDCKHSELPGKRRQSWAMPTVRTERVGSGDWTLGAARLGIGAIP